jgi:hypothetical protein
MLKFIFGSSAKARDGSWTEYGTSTVDGNNSYRSDLTCANVEAAYQTYLTTGNGGVVRFQTNGYPYDLHFDATPMYQQNVGGQVRTHVLYPLYCP